MTEQSFNTIYEKYKRMIFFYALKKCKNKVMAEEVTAQVFIEVWKYEEDFADKTHLERFMFKATRDRLVNTFIMDGRRRKAYAGIPSQDVDLGIDPEEIDRQEQEVLTRVFEIVEELPQRTRELFMLTCIKKLTLAHAAKIVGISRATATRTRQEAIWTIRHRLGYYGGKIIQFRAGRL